MVKEYKNLMGSLGYDINHKGFILFVSLTEEVRDLLKERESIEEVKKLLPSVYLEEYHFCKEMGKTTYMQLVNDFVNSRKVTPENEQVNGCFNLGRENLSLDDAVIFFGGYFNYIERIEEHRKEMMKKFSGK